MDTKGRVLINLAFRPIDIIMCYMCYEIYYLPLQAVRSIAKESKGGMQWFLFKLVYPYFSWSNFFFVII